MRTIDKGLPNSSGTKRSGSQGSGLLYDERRWRKFAIAKRVPSLVGSLEPPMRPLVDQSQRRERPSLEALQRFVSGLPTDMLDPLDKFLQTEFPEAITFAAVAGPAPDRSDRIAALLWQEGARRSGSQAAVATALRSTEVERLLGVSRAELVELTTSGNLSCVEVEGSKAYPRWQFHTTGIVPGIADVSSVFPMSALALAVWVTRRSTAFGGQTPREVLLSGDVTAVVAAARRLMATIR